MGKITKILTWTVVVLLLVAGIGLIIKFTNGLTEDLATFYVTIDDEDILHEAQGYSVATDEELQVEVKYLLNNTGYSVKVLPTTDESKDFRYLANDLIYSFESEEDYSAGFNIVQDESSFTITPKGGLKEILEAVCGSEVTYCDGKVFEDMFTLVVTSQDGTQINIHFTLDDAVKSVELNTAELAF